MKKIPSDIAVGSDLEVFLYDNEDKKIVPCVGILQGTKEDPYKPKGMPDGYAIQEDNVMVEYNIPPATSVGQFIKAMRTGRTMVLNELDRRYGTKYSLYTKKHSHKFRARDLVSPQAKLIGCEPDRNAYEGGSTRLNPPAPGLERSCGGHIHLGGDFKCPDFVAALFAELFIGVYGGICAPLTDPRAKWYGKPGIFRSKPYGIEYRTPNNSWGMTGGGMEIAGGQALKCARYLTNTDAVALQQAFRIMPWVKVREYMLSNKRTNESKALRHTILRSADQAGVRL